jgi:hypothetical protein
MKKYIPQAAASKGRFTRDILAAKGRVTNGDCNQTF